MVEIPVSYHLCLSCFFLDTLSTEQIGTVIVEHNWANDEVEQRRPQVRLDASPPLGVLRHDAADAG